MKFLPVSRSVSVTVKWVLAFYLREKRRMSVVHLLSLCVCIRTRNKNPWKLHSFRPLTAVEISSWSNFVTRSGPLGRLQRKVRQREKRCCLKKHVFKFCAPHKRNISLCHAETPYFSGKNEPLLMPQLLVCLFNVLKEMYNNTKLQTITRWCLFMQNIDINWIISFCVRVCFDYSQ